MAHVAYIRVSTDTQTTARQDDLMAGLVPAPSRIYRETKTGTSAARPILQKMLRELERGDVIHVESISRLARSTRDLLLIVEQITKRGAEWVSHKEQIDTTTPYGVFMMTVFAALAQLEREIMLQRQAEGFAAARKRGVRFGPEKTFPNDARLLQLVDDYNNNLITCTAAARILGMNKGTFSRRVKSLREAGGIEYNRATGGQ